MADIELIVKIDANVYTRLFDNGIQDDEIVVDDVCEMARALRLGTPLPKGHGRLVDADNLLEKAHWNENDTLVVNERDIYHAPTIIEADKGSEDK